MNNIKQAISEIKLVGFDIDGVMSDGGLIFNDSNVDFESKIFNVKDGFAIKLLQKSNKNKNLTKLRRKKYLK